MKTRTLAAAYMVAFFAMAIGTGHPVNAQPIVRPASPPVTGLSSWKVFLDPGHGQNGNVGVYGYSEARKVLAVGLEMRRLLLETTDIDTVYISRTTDDVNPSLAQRVDFANATGSDFYLSVHSNASGPTANTLFVLWPQHQDGSEVAPVGGKKMAQHVADALALGMRIPKSNNGIWGECDFYGADTCRGRVLLDRPGKGGSRNYVQSYTLMASALGEAGFHTNPVQNTRNMNADWKRLEARAEYWGILDYHGLPRPADYIVTGIVRDVESGVPVNGATVVVGDTTYVTDTYDTLFNQYSTDPHELRNGFFFLDRLDAGDRPVTVTAEGFEPFSGSVSPAPAVFTHVDAGLVSAIPPIVATTKPTDGQDPFRVTDAIQVDFSRPMDRATTEAAFRLDPPMTGFFTWQAGDRRLLFTPDSLRALTTYTLSIVQTATGAYGHGFDGNTDGVAGGDFSIGFTTGFPDTKPASIAGSFPRNNGTNVALRPVVTFVYSEPLDSTTVFSRVRLERASNSTAVPGEVRYWRVGEKGVVSFFPSAPLDAATSYRLVVQAGITDLFLNADPNEKRLSFTTGSMEEVVAPIDDFETGLPSNWWQPQQSGSTAGIVTTSTAMAADPYFANALFGGTTGMRLDYGWDSQTAEPLIRQYLGGGAPRALLFDQGRSLRLWVFGDGSGTRVRFALDDRVAPPSSTTGHEVSEWYTIDWIGWQPITWVLYEGQVGTWIGDGMLDGQLRIDSFQLTRSTTGTATGRLWFDDLQLVDAFSTASEDEETIPTGYLLEPNYPNPFNPSTTLEYALPTTSDVRIAVYDVLGRLVRVLHDGLMPAGRHRTTFDATGLSSGSYLVRLEAPGAVLSRTITLLR